MYVFKSRPQKYPCTEKNHNIAFCNSYSFMGFFAFFENKKTRKIVHAINKKIERISKKRARRWKEARNYFYKTHCNVDRASKNEGNFRWRFHILTFTYLPNTRKFFHKFFTSFCIFVGKVIFSTAEKVVFHKLFIYISKQPNRSIYLLSNISTITILFYHLHNLTESSLRFFKRKKEFFLKCWIFRNHIEKLKHE